ncbi:dipicolinate synthase subunit B [Lachnospiraceae bacterium LCP25S3_G4]
MDLRGKKIGVAITGSFCTFDKIFIELEGLKEAGADVTTIFSDASQRIDSRFGIAKKFMERAKELTGKQPILTIEKAEAVGPQKLFDALVLLPCTGNTMAKLANGITDSPVLMAAKAHLRNERPLIISLSTNDALGMNLKNIGLLMNVKNIYFVPFGQDNPTQKPSSMVAHTTYLQPTLQSAFEGKQVQPVVMSPFK